MKFKGVKFIVNQEGRELICAYIWKLNFHRHAGEVRLIMHYSNANVSSIHASLSLVCDKYFSWTKNNLRLLFSYRILVLKSHQKVLLHKVHLPDPCTQQRPRPCTAHHLRGLCTLHHHQGPCTPRTPQIQVCIHPLHTQIRCLTTLLHHILMDHSIPQVTPSFSLWFVYMFISILSHSPIIKNHT